MSTTAPVTDQFQYVKLPDGSYGKFAANAGDDVIRGQIQKDFPDAFKDNRSLYQKAKDNFNANTQGAKPGDGAVKGFIENVGQGGGDIVRSTAHMIAHPLDQAHSEVNALEAPHPLDRALNQAHTEVDAARANPSKAIGNAIGQIGTGAIIGEAAAPVVGAVARGAVAAPEAIGDAVSAAKAKLYPASQSLAPATSAARNLSKALVVDPAGVTNFVKSAADEAGTVVGYAQEKGLPINSKVDFANAAKQTADAVQTHFNDTILGPNAGKISAVPASYRGIRVGEGPNATLGDINKRIDAINQELNPNFRKGLASQTSAANVSDADLVAEKTALTNTLHNKLAAATGLQPAEIAAVRQQAGKLRTIADESMLSANRDLTATGRQGMGATTTSSIGTKAGIIDRTLQAVQGGPEVIGNRQILSALQKIQAKPMNLPQPTETGAPPMPRAPISGRPSTTIQGPDYTPDPNAAAILRARIAGRLKPAPAPVQPRPQLQLPAQTGGAYVLPNSVVPRMSEGEQIAALMQYLRKHPQAALPAKAGAIPLSPPK